MKENGVTGIKYTDFVARLKGDAEGPAKNIRRVFSEVLPFVHLMGKIKHQFESGMTISACLALIEKIESDPYDGYVKGREWIGRFIEDKMCGALTLARKHGTLESW